MFERFTEQARHAVVQAQHEARELGHTSIGTEHLLLGILGIEDGLGAQVLASLDISLDPTRERVVQIAGKSDRVVSGQIPFAPVAKKTLELSLREALSLGHNYIGTEDILLGLARVDDGVAAGLLPPPELIRERVIQLLGPAAARSQSGRRAFAAQRFGRPIWEYRLERRAQIDQEWLNELGAEGWELVDISGEVFVFKRRRGFSAELRAAG